MEMFGSQSDYLLFVIVCLCALAVITFWLRRFHNAGTSLVITWLALPTLLVPGWYFVEIAGQNERDRLRRRIEGLAPTYAEELRSMGHARITTETSADDPLYLAMINKQIRWLDINRAVADIYTFRQHPDGNQLIVDSETDYDHNDVYEGDRESRTKIGEIWDEDNEAVRRAYAGEAVFDDKIYTDRWGTWVSAYVPMVDQNGELEAVLGVDYPAEDWVRAIARARRFAIGFLAVIVTIAFASASVISVLRANLIERERTAKELLAAKNAAEAATKSKSEFLANMSHEIRTPMNGVIGMTDLLAGTDLNDQQREYLRIVKQSANSLLGLLNDILDFSKIEAGKLELESIPFALRDSIERTVQTLTFRGAEKGLEILCRIDPQIPDGLIGDPGRLSQVLVNLAGNAIKFTERGEVVINVEPESSADDQITLRFSVRDTGIGIAPDKLDSIFKAFSQEDASTTRRFGGTGLGLAICTQLTKLMGGRIWATSQKGEGTTFFFTSTFGLASDLAASAPVSADALEGLHVLVVDDNETNRFIMDELLKSWKMVPVMAASGPEAIGEMKIAQTNGHPYELALIDCMMPDMDGFELARIVGSDPALSGCQLIMISSAAAADDNARCRELGIARYMTKPIVQSELLLACQQVLSGPSRSTTASETSADEFVDAPRELRILLAEDGAVNQMVAQEMLKKHQHHVVVAEDGKKAVEACREQAFDLILMDVQMPEMDGLEATETIRRYESEHDGRVPIIAMTASAMKGDREMCLEAGMDDYLSKPIDANDLYAMIAKHARSHCKSDVGGDSARPVEGDAGQSADNLGQLTVIDLESAMKQVPGGLEGMQQMAPVLQQECKDMIAKLREALAAEDAAVVQRAAHTLKGAAAVFAAETVVDAALEMEILGKQDRLNHASSAMDELESRAAELCADLQSILLSATDA